MEGLLRLELSFAWAMEEGPESLRWLAPWFCEAGWSYGTSHMELAAEARELGGAWLVSEARENTDGLGA